MNVSIVIPNYNGEKYLIDCLTTLKKQSYQDYETILVDNGSTDNSVKIARDIMPNIICLLLGENKGFSAAVNQGILNSKGKYVALLNNDTLLTETWLENLLTCIESNENAFSCSSKMLQFHANNLIDNAGDALTLLDGHIKRDMVAILADIKIIGIFSLLVRVRQYIDVKLLIK